MKLVIHPMDSTTDFLEGVYRNLNETIVVRGIVDPSWLKGLISGSYTPIEELYMLGHGLPQGLLGFGKLMIDRSYVQHFSRLKRIVGIWCNADKFFEEHQLSGFCTGMFISEMVEAGVFNVSTTARELDVSNHVFAEAVAAAMSIAPYGKDPRPDILEIYSSDVMTRYMSSAPQSGETELYEFNRSRLAFYDQGVQAALKSDKEVITLGPSDLESSPDSQGAGIEVSEEGACTP